MIKVVAIMGKAGSGKDTLLHEIFKNQNQNFKEIISCTTRPPREGERDGVNYHFLNDEQFLNQVKHGEMLEYTEFRKWYYGTSMNNLDVNKINIGVFNPSGVGQLAQAKNVEVLIFEINCSDKERLLRQLNREVSPDVNEIIRRFHTDNEDFEFERINSMVKDKWHYIINNDATVELNAAASEIISVIEAWANSINSSVSNTIYSNGKEEDV